MSARILYLKWKANECYLFKEYLQVQMLKNYILLFIKSCHKFTFYINENAVVFSVCDCVFQYRWPMNKLCHTSLSESTKPLPSNPLISYGFIRYSVNLPSVIYFCISLNWEKSNYRLSALYENVQVNSRLLGTSHSVRGLKEPKLIPLMDQKTLGNC
jgi:hypothetical protein